MPHSVIELFGPERLRKLERKQKTIRFALWILGVAAAAACIVLTLTANNRNIYRMLAACICISIGTAWIIIYFGTYGVRDAGRELRYAANLAGEPRECVEGRVKPLRLIIRIRNSITLRKIQVETDQGPIQLTVQDNKAKELCRAGERLRLYTSHRYIVAYEVMDHADP